MKKLIVRAAYFLVSKDHAHIVCSDGTTQIPIFSKEAALRQLAVLVSRGAVSSVEEGIVREQICSSSIPDSTNFPSTLSAVIMDELLDELLYLIGEEETSAGHTVH